MSNFEWNDLHEYLIDRLQDGLKSLDQGGYDNATRHATAAQASAQLGLAAAVGSVAETLATLAPAIMKILEPAPPVVGGGSDVDQEVVPARQNHPRSAQEVPEVPQEAPDAPGGSQAADVLGRIRSFALDRQTPAVDGGLCDALSIWPSEILGMIGDWDGDR